MSTIIKTEYDTVELQNDLSEVLNLAEFEALQTEIGPGYKVPHKYLSYFIRCDHKTSVIELALQQGIEFDQPATQDDSYFTDYEYYLNLILSKLIRQAHTDPEHKYLVQVMRHVQAL